MRGADGRMLCLTRRQISQIIHAANNALADAPPLIAITANVAGLNCLPMTTGVESLPDGWLWVGKGDEEDTLVSLFISTKTARTWSSKAHCAHFLKLIGDSSYWENNDGLQLSSKISLRDATPYAREPLNDRGLFWVGDSAFAPDPLSGQGVHQALLCGVRAGIVLHTILTRKHAERVARDFYYLQHAETIQNHTSIAKAFYQRQDRFRSGFWNDRSSVDSSATNRPEMAGTAKMQLERNLAISADVNWKEISVNTGEFIETKRALFHPSLQRPVAYLEGHLLSDMLDVCSNGVTGNALVKKWSDKMGILKASGLRHLQFLLNHRILMAKSSPS